MDINLLDIPIYYINLSDSVNRNKHMVDLFNKYNIKNYQRFDASDYRKLNINYMNHKHPDMWFRNQNINVRTGEYAIFTSHILCIKKFLEQSDKDMCFIFEDDINFSFSEYYSDYFSNYIKKIPENADIVQLQFHLSENQFNKILNPNIIQHNKYSNNFTGAAAYLIKRSYASKIINDINFLDTNNIDFSNINYPPVFDWYIYKFTNNKYSIPLISINCNYDSSINQMGEEFEHISNKYILSRWEEMYMKNINKLKNIPKIFYINRDIDKVRNNYMIEQFKRFKITNYQRISASTPNNVIFFRKIKNDFISERNNDTNDTEYCVLISHIKCLIEAKNQNLKNIIIMEDDCSFSFINYYKNSFNEYINKCPEYNFIRLICQGWNTVYTLKNIKYTKEIDDSWRSNACYLITDKGIQNVLNKIKITNNVYDFRYFDDTIIADICIPRLSNNVYNIPLFTLNLTTTKNSTIQPNESWTSSYIKEQKYIEKLWINN